MCLYLALFLLPASTALAAAPAPVRTSNPGLEAFNNKTLWAQTLSERTDTPFSSSLRAELEYTELSDPHGTLHTQNMRPHTEAGGVVPAVADISGTKAVFVNLYHDFSNGPVRPYMSGGVGLAYDHALDRDEAAMAGMGGTTGTVGVQAQDTRLAWNAGVGVDVEASDNVRLDFGYRVAGTDGSARGFRQTMQGPGLTPMLNDSPTGAATHLFSAGISIGF